MLRDLSLAVGGLADETGRHIHLVPKTASTAQACWMRGKTHRAGKEPRAVERRLIITPGTYG